MNDNSHDDSNIVEIGATYSASRAEYYRHHYELSSNQLTEYAKWLSASLLAINGAGIVAILNAFTKLNHHPTVGSFFVFGMMAALFSGWSLQYFYAKSSIPSAELWILWKEAESAGQIDSKAVEKVEGSLNSAIKFRWIAPVSGWLSAISFLIGVVLFINNLR